MAFAQLIFTDKDGISVGLVANLSMRGEKDGNDDAEESDGAAKDLDDENLDEERGVGGVSHCCSRANLQQVFFRISKSGKLIRKKWPNLISVLWIRLK